MTSCVLVTVSLLPLSTALAQKTSTQVNTLIEIGNTLDDLGNHTGAIQYYDRALAIDPNNAALIYNKGLALHNQSNYIR